MRIQERKDTSHRSQPILNVKTRWTLDVSNVLAITEAETPLVRVNLLDIIGFVFVVCSTTVRLTSAPEHI